MNVFTASVFVLALVSGAPASTSDPSAYDVVWDTPSADSSGSMPIGNGDIGANVWVEKNGDLLLYLSKTDAWSENCRLLKLGRIRVALTPNPLKRNKPFLQTLALADGAIRVAYGTGKKQVRLRVWADANRPVLRIEAAGGAPFSMRVSIEPWRTGPRTIAGAELHSAYGLAEAPRTVEESGDVVVAGLSNRIAWYHRNETSIWRESLELQGLGAWADTANDPLLFRTFGALVAGDGFASRDSTTIASDSPRKDHRVNVYCLTAQHPFAGAWVEHVEGFAAADAGVSLTDAYAAHCAWWRAFWERSYIQVTGGAGDDARTVSQGYALQRFMTACAGRGAYPIKFNGSIFTVDPKDKKYPFDADYRSWGGPYWFQNTRLIYWPLLASGDTDLMQPFFRMYRDALPLALARTRVYFGHDGAFLPETIYFWGAYANDNYGWDRTGKPASLVDNRYIRWYWSGALELLAIMIDRYAYTGDDEFLRGTLLPSADALLPFFDQHYARDASGKLLFKPAQALETWQDAVNPLPDIAGLQWVLDALLALPEHAIGAPRRAAWQRLRGEVPPIPMREIGGEQVLAPAQEILARKANSENAELYAVFPYRIYGVGKPGLDLARRTFDRREEKRNVGWCQDATQAALLGLRDSAARLVAQRFATHDKNSRFPAFWGPNFDWTPDQDHGSNAMMALQSMILQTDGNRILLLPAWPAQWDVAFKLHAPQNTIVEGVYRDGKLERLRVTPQSRENDVEVMDASSEHGQPIPAS